MKSRKEGISRDCVISIVSFSLRNCIPGVCIWKREQDWAGKMKYLSVGMPAVLVERQVLVFPERVSLRDSLEASNTA